MSYIIISQSNSLDFSNFPSIIYISGLLSVPMVRIEKLFTDKIELSASYNKILSYFDAFSVKQINKRSISHIDTIKISNFQFNNFGLNLKIDSFNIEKGDLVKIAGKSGTGKSTFIKLLLSDSKKYIGNIYVNKKYPINEVNINISYISQNFSLFPLSLLKNITLSNSIDQQTIKKVEQILLQVGLGDKIKNINDNIDNYSNGELKRVEIARAIYFDSPIIIFDEAFTGIDNENKDSKNYKRAIFWKNILFYNTWWKFKNL